jgi:hypothetical protein
MRTRASWSLKIWPCCAETVLSIWIAPVVSNAYSRMASIFLAIS